MYFLVQCSQMIPLVPEASFCIRVLSLPTSVRPSVRPSVTKFFRAITLHPFELGSPNLNHMCWIPWLRSLLVWGGWLTLTFKVKCNFNIKISPFWACPRDNPSPVQARATKFRPQVQNTLIKVPIVLRSNWPWPWRSNLAKIRQIFWFHHSWKYITAT